MAEEKSISRLVFNFPGFEGNDLERQLDRLHAHAEQSGRLWGFGVERGEVTRHFGKPDDNNYGTVDYSCQGKNWEQQVRLVQFRWEDIIASYEKEPYPKLWFRNMPKFLSFFLDGAVFKYFAASVRYGGFTLYPLILMIVFALIGWFVSGFVLGLFMSSGLLMALLKAVFAFLAVLVFCKWPGDSAYINLTIADWGFARDMCNRSNPLIEERYEQFANGIMSELERSDAREVIFVGHSFGSVWAVAAVATALKRNPDLFKGREVTFFVLGSSLLKIALVPAAKHYREFSKLIFAQTGLLWHEIQTKIDVIAFYKSDPVKAMGIYPSRDDCPAQVIINKLAYSKLMDKKRYKKMRKSFYRTHRQYILHLDKRHPADFFLKLFGPFDSHKLANNTNLADRLDSSGELIDIKHGPAQ